MGTISGLLITVRTGRQGATMENGKLTPEYLEETSMLAINPEDLAALEMAPGQPARLKSPDGEVIVTCRPTTGPRGLFFLPLGPTASQLISGETHGTGVPDFKGLPVTLEPELKFSQQTDLGGHVDE
ncbi:molybdopterin dinucleotide binding domain-containing protein [Desulfosporosinus lacus]|uniref:Formylmethanofuran dehydrogenase, subunit D n=1 Tax=Desulfosporosinus lacus DSM 15449 TaxID=1121420 RepID=A0A1M6A0W1_9FIRM|nr:molybdopterin dinucleotide binding domain-containing protein [Desulfosporosinus lacus]SHI30122.1 formylmethanofuran dehydrogenase, subunit D [Desulfosporosinus lacus DSM 15449]